MNELNVASNNTVWLVLLVWHLGVWGQTNFRDSCEAWTDFYGDL